MPVHSPPLIEPADTPYICGINELPPPVPPPPPPEEQEEDALNISDPPGLLPPTGNQSTSMMPTLNALSYIS